MRISERQIQQLLFFCHQVMTPNCCLTELGRHQLSEIISEIVNQQSSELKDIE